MLQDGVASGCELSYSPVAEDRSCSQSNTKAPSHVRYQAACKQRAPANFEKVRLDADVIFFKNLFLDGLDNLFRLCACCHVAFVLRLESRWRKCVVIVRYLIHQNDVLRHKIVMKEPRESSHHSITINAAWCDVDHTGTQVLFFR